MIFEDIIVDMPAKKRITKYEKTHSKPYVYEIIARKNKDNPKEITRCVGVATEDGHMHPNENYFDLHPEAVEKKPENNPAEFDNQVHIGASVLLRAAARKIGLKETLDDCFPGYSELLQSLIEYYLVERDSTSQLFKYYLFDHYSELNYIPSDSTLSNFFNNKLSREDIKNFLNCWMKHRLQMMGPNAMVEVDFDSTNFNINSPNVDSAEYGKAKVKEGLPQINVAYFLDRSTGLPIYYDIYYGSINDMEHCKTAVGKIRAIDPKAKASFVLDRGYFSSGNLDFIEGNHFNYLCLGKDIDEFKRMVSVYPTHRIAKASQHIFGTIYGVKERGPVFKESGKEFYKYFYYDTSSIVTDLQYIQSQAEYAAKFVLGKKDKTGHIYETYKKLVNMEFDDKKVIIRATPNEKYIDHYRDTCGYFWIISNEDLTPKEVLEAYRHRDLIEKTFKSIKSDADLNKVYATSDGSFESKSLMAFLTAVLRAEITITLKPYFIQYSSETSQTVLKEVEKIKAEELCGKYRLRYALTSKQKQILSFYDLTLKDVSNYVDTINNLIPISNKADIR